MWAYADPKLVVLWSVVALKSLSLLNGITRDQVPMKVNEYLPNVEAAGLSKLSSRVATQTNPRFPYLIISYLQLCGLRNNPNHLQTGRNRINKIFGLTC